MTQPLAMPTDSIDAWAIVVLYHPNHDLLRQQFEATVTQVRGIVYCDNGGGTAALAQLGLLSRPGVACIGDGDNQGLAAALNDGLSFVQAKPAAFAFLLDQDSIPAPGMLAKLHEGCRREIDKGEKIAAIGPSIFDSLQGRIEHIGQAVAPSMRRVPAASQAVHEPFDVTYVITSGTLVNLACLEDVGSMDASLFIDSVDCEWCFRARSRGYRVLATYETALHHRQSDGLLHPMPGVYIRLYSPMRLYYIYRNHARLCYRQYVHWTWKVGRTMDLLVNTLAFALFVPGRAANLMAMCKGIWEGLQQGRADRRAVGSSGPDRCRQDV